jgi:adenylylsulfate reductase subunit B
MPTYVNPDKCDGGKAWNQEPDLCWECYACVKTCPQTAIDMRGYGDVVPLGASLAPLRGTDSIMWTVKFRNGQMKRFKFAIRTTPWGSIEPFRGLSAPAPEETKTPGLSGQAKYLGVEKLPTVTTR